MSDGCDSLRNIWGQRLCGFITAYVVQCLQFLVHCFRRENLLGLIDNLLDLVGNIYSGVK